MGPSKPVSSIYKIVVIEWLSLMKWNKERVKKGLSGSGCYRPRSVGDLSPSTQIQGPYKGATVSKQEEDWSASEEVRWPQTLI